MGITKGLKAHSGRRGSVLVLTLLVIATLTGLTVGFSDESSVELSLAGFSRDGYRAYEIARSAVHLGLAMLSNQDDEEIKERLKEWRTFGAHPFPHELPEGITFLGMILDESGKINVNGGSVAMGHPIGASGCRVLVTLLHEMKRTDKKIGMASLCLGGGEAVAMIVKR